MGIVRLLVADSIRIDNNEARERVLATLSSQLDALFEGRRTNILLTPEKDGDWRRNCFGLRYSGGEFQVGEKYNCHIKGNIFAIVENGSQKREEIKISEKDLPSSKEEFDIIVTANNFLALS